MIYETITKFLLPVVIVLVPVVGLVAFMSKKKRKNSSLIATPPGLPIIGNLLDVLPEQLLTTLATFPAKYGNFYELHFLGRRMLVVSDLETVKEILAKRPKLVRRGHDYDYMGKVLGLSPYGLFHAYDPTVWSRLRKLTVPAFSKMNIKKMTAVVVDETNNFVRRIKDASFTGETLDMKYWAQSYTVRVIGRVSFGSDGADYFYSHMFYEDVQELFKAMLLSSTYPLPQFFWKFTHLRYERRALEGDRRFNAACQQIIDRKRQAYANKININNHALLDILIRQEESRDLKAISDQEILANVKIFYLAGSETTSVAISWSLFYLSQNPKLLADIRKEADPFFSQDLASLSEDDLSSEAYKLRLSYFLIKEAIRLNSPASVLGVEPVDDDLELSNEVIMYKSDDCLVVLQNALLDASIYENPTECIPHRWLTEDKDALQRMESAYIAFGHGARICPGMNLSLLEGALAVAAIAHSFDIELACSPKDIHPELNFTTQPSKMPIRFTPLK